MSGPATDRPVLILGGTAEALDLAIRLQEAGIRAITSLAGRVSRPRLPAGEVRIGGFGGADRLQNWLVENQIVAVVDATHPFASQISGSAAVATNATGVPLLRIERPGWIEQPGDRWHWVDDLDAAAALAPELGRRIMLTIGRQGVSAFRAVHSWLLIRCVEPPEGPLPPHHVLLLDRGPFTLGGELALIREHLIDLIVTRDSGGRSTEAKIEAARLTGLPVVVIRRPPSEVVAAVPDVASAVEWARSVLNARGSEAAGS